MVRTDTVTTFGSPVVFTLASPDQTRQHTWSVTIDATWSADQTWSRPSRRARPGPRRRCPARARHPRDASARVGRAGDHGGTDVPPPSSSTVVTIPRTPVSTESFELPATGGDTSGTLAIGAALVAAGRGGAHRRRRAS